MRTKHPLNLDYDGDVIPMKLISSHLVHAVLVDLFRVQMTHGLKENNSVEAH